MLARSTCTPIRYVYIRTSKFHIPSRPLDEKKMARGTFTMLEPDTVRINIRIERTVNAGRRDNIKTKN